MKISKPRWEDIKNYIFSHSRDIWVLAVSHTSDIHDAIVWLTGIEKGNFRLWAEMCTTGEIEHPDNVSDSLQVYRLNRNWADYIIIADICIKWELGYDLFLEELQDDWFWRKMLYINDVEIVEITTERR